MNDQGRPPPNRAGQARNSRGFFHSLHDNLPFIASIATILCALATLATVIAAAYIFNHTLDDTHQLIEQLRNDFVTHDKESFGQMGDIQGRLDDVEKSLGGLQGNTKSEVAPISGQEVEPGTMGLIAQEYVGKPMYCRDPATNAECTYSDQARTIAVAKWLLTRFPCGSQVTVCRLDIPTLCAENVTVGDAFEADRGDPRKFNTSPKIADELQYAGSGVAEVIISGGTK